MSARTGEKPAEPPRTERLVGVVALFCLVACAACMAFCVTGPWGGFGLLGRRTGLYPRSFAVTLGDLDGDGDLDAFVANGHTDDLGKANTVWLNNGRGRFRNSGQRLGSYTSDSRAVALGDLDGDGDLDAFVGANNGYSTVWLNAGSGGMSSNGQRLFVKEVVGGEPASMGLYSHSVALADLDGDGDLDAFAAGSASDSYNLIWLNDGRGTFGDSGQYLGLLQSHAVPIGDVDGDGDLDAFVANGHAPYLGEPNKVWLNNGRGWFIDSGQRLGYPAFNSDDSRAVALGDVDGDGDLDAFVGNDGPNEVWLNDGSGAFSYGLQELGDGCTHGVFLDDLDGDGDLDALAANRTTAQVWLNDGAGRFADGNQAILYSYRDAVVLGDLDGDGDGDVLAMRYGRGYQTWYNDGVGHFDLQHPRGRVLYWLAGGVPVTIAAGLFIWRAIQRQGIIFATDKH